ncbi:50S ribosomal protein L35 [bacterium]|nr:50S ribosomal protein L35 [bacterium]
MAHTAKTHSGAKKRFGLTAKGKVFSKKQGNNHLLTNKGKTRQKFPYAKEIKGVFAKRIKGLMA